jgi:hypothetical protein
MSIREHIVDNIVKTLANAEEPRFGLVTREHFDPTKLSRQQFPAVYVATADETRTDVSMTGSGMTRECNLNIQLAAYVNGKNIDTLRNDIVERIEEELELDRTRGGVARITRITEITVDFDQVDYLGRVDILVEVYYTYRRGTV